MINVFTHTDEEGDEVRLREFYEYLILRAKDGSDHQFAEVRLHRETVLRLHNALGEWLYPTGVATQDTPLQPADIRALVAERAAEIMALHQSPQAKYVDASADSHDGPLDPEPHDACTCSHDESSHGSIGCTAPYRLGPVQLICRCQWRVDPEPDPEPHDVGHPDPADKPPLPVRNPLASFVELVAGVLKAQAEIVQRAEEAARPHPQPTWDDHLWSEVPDAREWIKCPCELTGVPAGAECRRCGHTRHISHGCTARVRRVQP